MDNINIEKLRNDLIDYFGTAFFSGFFSASIDISRIENASDYELIKIAENNGFDLDNYRNSFRR